MKRRSTTLPKHWMPVSTISGPPRTGVYEVSNDTLTVQFEGRFKSVRASSAAVPSSMGAKADEGLARLILASEF
jgi:hypothetical protein